MIESLLVGDREIVRKFDALPTRLRDEMKIGVGRLALKLARNVQQNKLSGQMLNVRTGRLRRSIASLVEDNSQTVSGIVSTPVKYAPPNEYGFKGTVTVAQSLRTIKQAFGRPIEEKTITVRAHQRKMNLPERSFLRSALRDMEQSGQIGREMDDAIARSLA